MYEGEEEEEECRVCRSEAEPDRPLFHPCKCSGSIGLTHQDCLKSWLEVQRSDGRCEVCKTKFRFAPQYAEGTPARLSWPETALVLLRKTVVSWLPLALRCVLAASLWLIVAPLCTCYLYYGWAHKSATLYDRVTSLDLIPKDIVAGAVVIVSIIISFLALMSFGEFLRVEWLRGGLRRPRIRFPDAPPRPKPTDDEIDKTLCDRMQNPNGVNDPNQTETVDSDDDSDYLGSESYSDGSSDEANDEDEVPDVQDEEVFDFPINNDLNGEEQAEFDINIALDEMLGFRGAFAGVVRNFLWLMAFNMVYLGFFLFAPRVIGSTFYSSFNTTATQSGFNETRVYAWIAHSPVAKLVAAIDAESDKANSVFRIPDLSIVFVGYLICSCSLILCRVCWDFGKKVQALYRRHRGTGNRVHLENDLNFNRERREFQNLFRNIVQNEGEMGQNNALDVNVDDDIAIGEVIEVSFEATMAVVQVSVLLFIKMLCLPITLGLCLRLMTLDIIGGSVEGMISLAGTDLFSFGFLHWVIGITFMLLVTVAVLQFREVMHPDLLSGLIRPQEPQPDLLGNLMSESIPTHIKRMSVSVFIYGLLLFLHFSLPLRIGKALGLDKYFGIFYFRYSYLIMPGFQIPIELLLFHLTMLALLEKNKNSIGKLQHFWLKHMCRWMNLQNELLPHSVKDFRFVGGLQYALPSGEADPFWLLLCERNDEVDREHLLAAQLSRFDPTVFRGRKGVRANVYGECLLATHDEYIMLPYFSGNNSSHSLLPQKIGRYRLAVLEKEGTGLMIGVFEETLGDVVPRPPEGWDDLGGGGADVQGRWAWRKEKKSKVEESIARRSLIFPPGRSMWAHFLTSMKLVFMILCGWASTSFLVFVSFFGPLMTGRAVCFFLRVPQAWIHDFFCISGGALIYFPVVTRAAKSVSSSGSNMLRVLLSWVTTYRSPSPHKAAIMILTIFLWFFVSPTLLGCIYSLGVLTPTEWFENPNDFSLSQLVMNWLSGNVFLALWSYLCILGVCDTRFWNVLFGRNDRAAEAEGNGNEQRWQGSSGRISCFWKCLWLAFSRWEWDRVDSDVLLANCALPVFKGLLFIAFPPLLMVFSSRLFPSESRKFLTSGASLRACLLVTLFDQLGKMWGKELSLFVESGRKYARDERYLVGEILLNYSE